MILVVGVILLLLMVWGIRVAIRKVRKHARSRAEARARAAACANTTDDADEHSPARCSPL
jgi:hypothetical protein